MKASLTVLVIALGVATLSCTLLTGQIVTQPTQTPFVVTATPGPPGMPSSDQTTSEQGTSSVQGASVASGLPSSAVQGQADEAINIRIRPSPDCQIIGLVPRGEIINLLVRTSSPTEYWYQTDYPGADNPGWVYHGPLTLLSDDSSLPRVAEQSCLAAGPEVAPGTCVSGPGNCCGDGVCQTDESPDWCGDCVTLEEGAVCGNGVVEGGEACEPSFGCSGGLVCKNCQCVPLEVEIIPPDSFDVCGDGLCADEEWNTCLIDCDPEAAACGNGRCDPWESPPSCPQDC
jgi:hypothetical protein